MFVDDVLQFGRLGRLQTIQTQVQQRLDTKAETHNNTL